MRRGGGGESTFECVGKKISFNVPFFFSCSENVHMSEEKQRIMLLERVSRLSVRLSITANCYKCLLVLWCNIALAKLINTILRNVFYLNDFRIGITEVIQNKY